MKPLNGYGRRNPADTDGIADKWAGNTPGTDRAKLNPPPEKPRCSPKNSTVVLHPPPLLAFPSLNQDGVQVSPQWLTPAPLTVHATISNPILPLTN